MLFELFLDTWEACLEPDANKKSKHDGQAKVNRFFETWKE